MSKSRGGKEASRPGWTRGGKDASAGARGENARGLAPISTAAERSARGRRVPLPTVLQGSGSGFKMSGICHKGEINPSCPVKVDA